MPKLYIAEFSGQQVDAGLARIPAGSLPAVAHQVVDFAGTSVQSQLFNTATRYVRLHADAACHVLVSSGNPTATTINMRLPADGVEYFAVQPGQRLAVIES